jgi:hypothetical protein
VRQVLQPGGVPEEAMDHARALGLLNFSTRHREKRWREAAVKFADKSAEISWHSITDLKAGRERRRRNHVMRGYHKAPTAKAGQLDGPSSEQCFDLVENFDDISERHDQLLMALQETKRGHQLKATGFPQEAEFRFMVAIAEFCEDSGVDARVQDRPGRKAAVRNLDKQLYFHGFMDASIEVLPQRGLVERVYAAYATLAELYYEYATQAEQAMLQGEENSESHGKLQGLQSRWLNDANDSLVAWLGWLEMVAGWHADWPEASSRPLRSVPDKDEILNASRLLLMTLKFKQVNLATRLYAATNHFLDLSIHTYVKPSAEEWFQDFTAKRLVQRNAKEATNAKETAERVLAIESPMSPSDAKNMQIQASNAADAEV